MKSTNRLATALTLAAAAAFAVLPAFAGQRMVSFELRTAFNGVTLDGIYEDGSFFSETYNEDGTIRYHDQLGSDVGNWSVRGDTFCTFYKHQEGSCFFVERDGDNCYSFFAVQLDQGGRQSAEKNWTSRGWNRAKQGTCPKAPATDI
jgi:hypothetical protein